MTQLQNYSVIETHKLTKQKTSIITMKISAFAPIIIVRVTKTSKNELQIRRMKSY